VHVPVLPESTPRQLRVAVLASGRGSNLQALQNATEQAALPVRVVGVFSDNADSGAIAFAKARRIAHTPLDPAHFSNREAFDRALMQAVSATDPELIVCAGFMRILSAVGIHAAPCPMINIHPSLLPKYPGLNTHSRALAAEDREHGASVHRVETILDGGRILAQAKVPVLPDDTASSLAERVLGIEHPLLIATVRAIAMGRLQPQDESGSVLWLRNDGLDLE
jgi:phosphoribosylglycinamide formyltransferase 1